MTINLKIIHKSSLNQLAEEIFLCKLDFEI